MVLSSSITVISAWFSPVPSFMLVSLFIISGLFILILVYLPGYSMLFIWNSPFFIWVVYFGVVVQLVSRLISPWVMFLFVNMPVIVPFRLAVCCCVGGCGPSGFVLHAGLLIPMYAARIMLVMVVSVFFRKFLLVVLLFFVLVFCSRLIFFLGVVVVVLFYKTFGFVTITWWL